MKPTWTPIRIKLGQLQPWSENPRTSTKAQAKRILASFEQFGQVVPVVIGPSAEVYDGHQRLSALLTVHGPDYEIEARQSDRPLTDEERRALVLALANATGSWNWDSLSNWDTSTLSEWGFDRDTLKGWKADVTALGEFLKSEQPTQDAEPETDRAAELLEKWQVKPGDMFAIGEHRLICGDCTDAATVARVVAGDKIDMIFTDPPYGVDYEYNGHKDDPGEYIKLADGFWAACPDARLKMLTVGHKWNNHWFAKNPQGFLIWFDKTKQSPSNVAHLCKSELILIFGKVYSRFAWDTLEIEQPRNDGLRELHTCPKPLELWQKVIDQQSEAQTIYEPFSGSGTTLVACQNLGRKCRAVEISPAYVAVALERMSTAFPGIDIHRIE